MISPPPIPMFGFPGEEAHGDAYVVPPQPELGIAGARAWRRFTDGGPRYGVGPEPPSSMGNVRFADDLIDLLALLYHQTGYQPCNTRSPNLIPSAPSSAQIENPLPTK